MQSSGKEGDFNNPTLAVLSDRCVSNYLQCDKLSFSFSFVSLNKNEY